MTKLKNDTHIASCNNIYNHNIILLLAIADDLLR